MSTEQKKSIPLGKGQKNSSKEKREHKIPMVSVEPVMAIGKFRGKGPKIPTEKEMAEAILNAQEVNKLRSPEKPDTDNQTSD